MVTPDQPDNGQIAFNYFVGQGLSPAQAAGIVGNLQGESGQGLNSAAINRGDGGDGSDSIGIGQWNGQRAQALKDYAVSKGVPWTDLNTQLEFLHSELEGSESRAGQGLMAAKTPEEAGQAMLAYERPKDWNKPGAHPERAQYAARAYAAYAGSPAAAPQPPVQGILTPAQTAQTAQAPGILNAPQDNGADLQGFQTRLAQLAAQYEQPQAIPALPPIKFAMPQGMRTKLLSALRGA